MTEGARLLEHTREQFLEDLAESFGERSADFGAELKSLLFELWVRARSRPPFPAVEPADAAKQEDFEGRLACALIRIATFKNIELKREFVQAVQRSIAVGAGIVRNDGIDHLSLHLDPARTVSR